MHLEVLELRKQVAELEERLGTAWKEGRVVSSRQQLRAPDSTALRREVGPLRWPLIRPCRWPVQGLLCVLCPLHGWCGL